VAVEAGQAMWIDLLYFMAWIKLAVSLIKYLPQVRHIQDLVHMLCTLSYIVPLGNRCG
jgi:hypothetical protein